MLKTLEGYWDPVVWVIAFVVIALVAYIIRAMGKRDFKREGEKDKPFLSGMEVEKEKAHPAGRNVYWGFTEALKGYYGVMRKMHSGMINDYVAWFVGVSAIMFIAIFLLEVV